MQKCGEKRLSREIMAPCLKCWEDVTEKMYCFPCKARAPIFLFSLAGTDRKMYGKSYFLKGFSSSALLAVALAFEAANICLYALLEFLSDPQTCFLNLSSHSNCIQQCKIADTLNRT